MHFADLIIRLQSVSVQDAVTNRSRFTVSVRIGHVLPDCGGSRRRGLRIRKSGWRDKDRDQVGRTVGADIGQGCNSMKSGGNGGRDLGGEGVDSLFVLIEAPSPS